MRRELQWVPSDGAHSSVLTITASTSAIGDLAWHARPRLVVKALDAALDEAAAPLADRRLIDPEPGGHVLVPRPVGAHQHDPGSCRLRLRSSSRPVPSAP